MIDVARIKIKSCLHLGKVRAVARIAYELFNGVCIFKQLVWNISCHYQLHELSTLNSLLQLNIEFLDLSLMLSWLPAW